MGLFKIFIFLPVLLFLAGFAYAGECIEVATPQDLNNVRNNLGACYVQTANIDLQSYNNFLPIGNEGGFNFEFVGSYDGRGYKIINLKIIDRTSFNTGLFRKAFGSEIKNIVFENADIIGGSRVGTLAGVAILSNMENITVYNTEIAGKDFIGGVVGTMEQSSADKLGFVNGYIKNRPNFGGALIGGVVGNAINTMIKNSYMLNSSLVSDSEEVSSGQSGGIAGDIDHSTIKDSYSQGYIRSDGAAGGIVAISSDSLIENSANLCPLLDNSIDLEELGKSPEEFTQCFVRGGESAGGIVAWASDTTLKKVSSKSLVFGHIDSPQNSFGGIAGFFGGKIINSYSQGIVIGVKRVGGLVGFASGGSNSIIKDSYSTGIVYSSGPLVGG